MKRSIALLTTFVVLTCGPVACAFNPYDPGAKKLMPKDQLAIFEKMEALADQDWSLSSRIKEAKQRQEEKERIGTQARELHELMITKLKTEGLKDWIGTCDILMPDNAVVFDSWQAIRTSLQTSKKATGKVPDALNAVKLKEIIRFSTKPDASYAMPKDRTKNLYGIDLIIKLDTITAVEKVGTRPDPVPKTPAPKKK
ncbi:MAG TPA: hypothetical protein VHR66_21365 [Gemmataceae bacterium]|nr:hypothetical protein [Gemmataceae bacterium]